MHIEIHKVLLARSFKLALMFLACLLLILASFLFLCGLSAACKSSLLVGFI